MDWNRHGGAVARERSPVLVGQLTPGPVVVLVGGRLTTARGPWAHGRAPEQTRHAPETPVT